MQWPKRRSTPNFESLPGRYETIPLPPVDLIVGCFLVYNRETALAMAQLLSRSPIPILLMNDKMAFFQKLVQDSPRSTRSLLSPEDPPCILFK